jgi:hypothetical protein
MNNEQFALVYASLGLRVIPLYETSKTPRIERWAERASADPEQITRWFECWPDSNVVILTGGGIIALDVDVRNGGMKSFKTLLKGRQLPETAEAITGTGGRHFLFRVDPALAIRNIDGLLPGIDVKGERGWLVVKTSVHPSDRDHLALGPLFVSRRIAPWTTTT